MKKGFLTFLTVCTTLTCQAEEYFFKPLISASERYTDNLFLFVDPEQDNWITTVSPGVNFGVRHENGELNTNFTWNQLFYTNQSELNIDEQLFGANYQHQTERFKWEMDASYNNRASLNSTGTDIGLVFQQVMRSDLTLAPSVTYALSPRSTLAFDYSYNEVTYEKSNSLGNNIFLSDYDYHQASGTFNHLYTELDKLSLTLSSSRYHSPSEFAQQTTYNNVAQVGWQHTFNEKWVAFAAVGANYSQSNVTQQIPDLCFFGNVLVDISPCPSFAPFRFVAAEEVTTQKSGFGQVYRGFVQKTFDHGGFSASGSQNQTPSAQGLQTQTELAVNGYYTINERWSSSITANYSIYEMTGQRNSQLNRTYYTISPAVSWRWTPEINLDLSYTYRQQEFDGGSQPAIGNSVQLQFNYQPQTNYQVK
ncbi:MAG: hypothetical protein HOP23_03300 [Methylococcaceae bacterium]|nr:hypothetical protein [Methylococcaceae bacterium]